MPFRSSTSPKHPIGNLDADPFLHFPGIGPCRQQQLYDCGIVQWEQIGPEPPPELHCLHSHWPAIRSMARQCIAARQTQNLGFLASTLVSPDRWRILANHWKQAAYIDIETSGLDMDSVITVIAAWQEGTLRLFVQGENLEDFLDYIDTVPLAVTFNGSTFDFPVICRQFHIHELPPPHLDLRWICHHAGWHGGLKSIERQLQLTRPEDLQEVDGNVAVWLWQQWEQHHAESARARLLRYCSADVIMLEQVVAKLLKDDSAITATRLKACWKTLDAIVPPPSPSTTFASTVPSPSPSEARPAPTPSPSAAPPPSPSAVQPALSPPALERLRTFLSRKR